ncbi:MAG: dihydrofolate reductase [Candidatus Pacebacteria bacterium]|nr:dihydrofolate reductase [Candidatus Paceibacterota bacterium]MCF7862476.1 dihydrofolate reductase [Candidatus Paceibacterota bacterium]
MNISIIAAIGKNRELGLNNQLLWHLPADMKHFRETTRGHTIIMGRKTFESLGETNGKAGKILPNRKNIIITRDPHYNIEHTKTEDRKNISIFSSLEEVLKNISEEEVFVIGGAEIYKLALPYANKLYLTEVEASMEADTFFPEFKKEEWQLDKNEYFPKNSENTYDMYFNVYRRV